MKKRIAPNWIDKTIAYFAPNYGNKRFLARARATLLESTLRSYDGAAKTRRTAHWKAGSGSANTEIRPTLETLRNRSRYLVRNEAYATRAIDAYESNVVGSGIMATPKAKTKGRADKFKLEWMDWAESVACDFDSRNNFYGLQGLAMRGIAEGGEMLLRRVWTNESGSRMPFQVQLLEGDFLDISKDGETTQDGGFIVQGVEFSPTGRRRAYWLWDQHPGDQSISFKKRIESKRVDAKDIIHLFRVERAGQVRGVPWLAPILIRMKDHSDWADATLLRQKLAACFTAFVTDTSGVDTDLGGDSTDGYTLGEKLEPGIIELLKPGQSVEFANPPSASDFESFSVPQIRAMSAGLGLTYEVLSGDYSRVNFSSGRMGWIEFHRNIEKWRWQMLIPHMCTGVWKWFCEAAAIMGMGSDPVVSLWTPPRREMIDPVKEVNATKEQIKGGLKSLSEAIRENGYEPEEVMKELAEDLETARKLGLKLDVDGNTPAATASSQNNNNAQQASQDDSEEDESKNSDDDSAENDEQP